MVALLTFALAWVPLDGPPPRAADAYAWNHAPITRTVGDLAAPEGTTRVAVEPGSFGAWLRGVPLLPGRPQVRLHDGGLRWFQGGHVAVVDLDVGKADLQQCADTVIRLRAEWLWSAGRAAEACFHFTSGDAAPWSRWAAGERYAVKGRKVTWQKKAKPDASHEAYRAWLQAVFVYAGTLSLFAETTPVASVAQVQPGDVLVQGGSPGHAVVVADVARAADGTTHVLVIQGHMPAQQAHVVARPGDTAAAWHVLRDGAALELPEWTFEPGSLHRFPQKVCR